MENFVLKIELGYTKVWPAETELYVKNVLDIFQKEDMFIPGDMKYLNETSVYIEKDIEFSSIEIQYNRGSHRTIYRVEQNTLVIAYDPV